MADQPSGQSSAPEFDSGVSVSDFDYSVDNFFAAMGEISALCGASDAEESFKASEVERFSSMITFLKEWRQYYYKPKAINFAYETKSTEVKDVMEGISLSQFSSAVVPKMEQLPDKTRLLDSNDFILHAGGPVWALDWCPRIAEKFDYNTKCEYLAVAAHPPDCTYHKVGVPLTGRGIIQIWCLLCIDEKAEFMPPRPKGRGRPGRKLFREEPLHDLSCEKEASAAVRPKGRPRKRDVDKDPLYERNDEEGPYPSRARGRPKKRPIVGTHDSKDMQGVSLKKPRGRPRKIPVVGLNVVKGSSLPRPTRKRVLPIVTNLSDKKEPPSYNSCPIQIVNENIPPLSADLRELALALPAADDSNGNEESFLSRSREGPRKKPIPSVNVCVPERGVELGEDASALPTSRGLEDSNAKGLSVDLEEFQLPLPAPDNLNVKGESFVPRRRGRLQKKPISSGNECASASASELGKDASAMPTSQGLEDSSANGFNVDSKEVAFALPDFTDLSGKVGSFVPRHRGRPRKKPIPSRNECAPASAVELGEVASALPASRGVENSSLNGSSVNLQEVAYALPAFTDLSGKVGSFVPRSRGRPRKKQIPNVNECIPTSGVGGGEDASALLNSGGLDNSSTKCLSVDSDEVAFTLPASTDINGKEGSSMPRRKGGPRKKSIPDVNKSVRAPVVELGEDASALPASGGLESSSIDGSLGGCTTDKALLACTKKQRIGDQVRVITDKSAKDQSLSNADRNELSVTVVPENCENSVLPISKIVDGFKMRMCEGLNNNQLAIKTGQTVRVQRIKDVARAVARKRGRYPILSPSGEDKDLPVIVEANHDYQCQNAMVLSELVGRNRSHKAGTTSSVIPKGIALPRIVLCLAHNGKVAWDVKWRPSNINNSDGKRHMGYLAVLLGDGSLEVWEVPLPKTVKILYTSCGREGTDPRFLKLEPVFRCSMVKCGDRQSIPLTVEWSPSASRDLILAGCHDGTVAMWKFSTNYSSQDTKPVLCFTADSVPIRALAWSPDESDAESANLIVTAGHEGLKFWDIRDPYRPLWDFNPVQRVILSLDWLKKPRCIILSLDDGTLRTISLWNAAYDAPVTGKPFVGTKQPGMHNYQCSPFAIWSIQVSRTTGLAAYCGSDGSALRFQLTAKSVDKDTKVRYREPHFLCGSLIEEGQTLKINTPLPNSPLPDIPLSTKKPSSDSRYAPQTLRSYLSDANQVLRPDPPFPALCSGDDQYIGEPQTPPTRQTPPKPASSKRQKAIPRSVSGRAKSSGAAVGGGGEIQDGEPGRKIEVLPPKIVAMHRVRWNMNKGCERWLCYGGAAGIIRCQEIPLPTMP